MHYTEEQFLAANEIPIVDILCGNGEQIKKVGNVQIWTTHDSVRFNGSKWFRFSTGEGGRSVGFCMSFFDMPCAAAVSYLLQTFRPELADLESETIRRSLHGGSSNDKAECAAEKKISPENTPSKNPTNDLLRNYLCQVRCIDPRIVSFFIQEGVLYETRGNHHIAFVGRDRDARVRNIQLRGTDDSNGKYRKNVKGSDLSFGFCHQGVTNRVYVFEAPIDLMSFLTLYPKDWERHSYVALGGVSKNALERMLADNEHIDTVVLCLDNDDAGRKACRRITEEMETIEGIRLRRLLPIHKDWNEDLVALAEKMEGEQICHHLLS